jgi:putative addiction module component (TIGR02574 family)
VAVIEGGDIMAELDRPSEDGDIDDAWDAEIRARVKAVDEGRAAGIPYDDIRKEMAGRFPRDNHQVFTPGTPNR